MPLFDIDLTKSTSFATAIPKGIDYQRDYFNQTYILADKVPLGKTNLSATVGIKVLQPNVITRFGIQLTDPQSSGLKREISMQISTGDKYRGNIPAIEHMSSMPISKPQVGIRGIAFEMSPQDYDWYYSVRCAVSVHRDSGETPASVTIVQSPVIVPAFVEPPPEPEPYIPPPEPTPVVKPWWVCGTLLIVMTSIMGLLMCVL